MNLSEMKRLKQLEDENSNLKRLVADQALDILVLKDINSKNYYQPKPLCNKEARQVLKEVAHKRRRWGYRRLMILLKRKGFHMNHKKVLRLYQEEKLQLHRRKKKKTREWRGKKVSFQHIRMNDGAWILFMTEWSIKSE